MDMPKDNLEQKILKYLKRLKKKEIEASPSAITDNTDSHYYLIKPLLQTMVDEGKIIRNTRKTSKGKPQFRYVLPD